MKKSLVSLLAVFSMLSVFSADLILESGNYRVVFSDKPELYSITHIWYQNAELGTRSGFYGNILAPENGKYIGAGHTEGGVEKLLECKLSVDGKDVEPGGKTVKGGKLIFSKKSRLDHVLMHVIYTLTEDGLKIDKRFETLAEQPVYSLYLYQFCWNSCSTDYFFRRRNGTSATGKFQSNRKMCIYGEPEAYCFAQYFPTFNLGVMNYLCGFGAYRGKNLLWDCPNYHKYYFWLDLPEKLPAGYQSDGITMIVRAFDASSRETWLQKAGSLADSLLKQYPFAPNPVHQSPLPAGLVMKGNGKFQCHKVPLALDPGKIYGISFEIRKTPPVSNKASDHFVLIGYYDLERKFHPVASFASNVKSDGEWVKIEGAFKSPTTYENLFLYVYNSHAEGEVALRALEINKQSE